MVYDEIYNNKDISTVYSIYCNLFIFLNSKTHRYIHKHDWHTDRKIHKSTDRQDRQTDG